MDCHQEKKNKYLTQLPQENGKAIHDEEVAASTGKPDATKQQERFLPSLSSSSTTVMPIDHRNWHDIPAVDDVDEKSFFFSECLEVTDPNTAASRSSSRN